MQNNQKELILDFDLEQLKDLLSQWKEPGYRAKQLWEGLYKQLWDEASNFSNLPLKTREKLDKHFLFTTLVPQQSSQSIDKQTTKTLYRLQDGHYIETILMRYRSRNSLCISSQVGCGLDCIFCATGQIGLKRNLTSGEIIEQVLWHVRD